MILKVMSWEGTSFGIVAVSMFSLTLLSLRLGVLHGTGETLSWTLADCSDLERQTAA